MFVKILVIIASVCSMYEARNATIIPVTDGEAYKTCPLVCSCGFVKRKVLESKSIGQEKNLPVRYEMVTQVICRRKQLTLIPMDLATNTKVLFLDHNAFTHLNRSMFDGFNQLVHISFAHNKISSMANDTFYELPLLETLDLNHNMLKSFPVGVLCPWLPAYAYKTALFMEPACAGVLAAITKLSLRIDSNRWHCNCKLQTFIETYSCAYENTCVIFVQDRDGAMGYCSSPANMKSIAIDRLSSDESAPKKVNACSYRKTHIDIPLLVTLFTWIGAVLGYVIYFISWNNKDVANHRTYLTNLDTQRATSKFSPYFGSTRSVLDGTPKSRSRASTMPCTPDYREKAKQIRKDRKEEEERDKIHSVDGTRTGIWLPRSPAQQRAKSASPRPHRVGFKRTISPLYEVPDAAERTLLEDYVSSTEQLGETSSNIKPFIL